MIVISYQRVIKTSLPLQRLRCFVANQLEIAGLSLVTNTLLKKKQTNLTSLFVHVDLM